MSRFYKQLLLCTFLALFASNGVLQAASLYESVMRQGNQTYDWAKKNKSVAAALGGLTATSVVATALWWRSSAEVARQGQDIENLRKSKAHQDAEIKRLRKPLRTLATPSQRKSEPSQDTLSQSLLASRNENGRLQNQLVQRDGELQQKQERIRQLEGQQVEFDRLRAENFRMSTNFDREVAAAKKAADAEREELAAKIIALNAERQQEFFSRGQGQQAAHSQELQRLTAERDAAKQRAGRYLGRYVMLAARSARSNAKSTCAITTLRWHGIALQQELKQKSREYITDYHALDELHKQKIAELEADAAKRLSEMASQMRAQRELTEALSARSSAGGSDGAEPQAAAKSENRSTIGLRNEVSRLQGIERKCEEMEAQNRALEAQKNSVAGRLLGLNERIGVQDREIYALRGKNVSLVAQLEAAQTYKAEAQAYKAKADSLQVVIDKLDTTMGEN